MMMYGEEEIQLSLMLLLLYPWGKSPWYPLGRRLVGPQSWCGHGGEEKKPPAPAGNRTPVIHSTA